MGLDQLHNVIGGAASAAADGRTTEIIDPTSGEAYATAPLSGSADVDRAFAAAASGFVGWRDATPATARAVSMWEDTPPMVDQIRFFAGAARVLEGKSAGEYMTGMTSMIRREPIGVCGQVTPWNYPMMMAVWKFAPALAAGNAIVLKPSDTTPVSTLLLAEIAAGILPPGVFNVICGDRDTGRALVAHDIPQLVSITGSVRAGTEVAR